MIFQGFDFETSIPFDLTILHHDEASILVMSRKAEKENSVAGTEAFRGAVVGTAKVKVPPRPHPQLPAAHTFCNCLPNLGYTDTKCSVGSPCWWSWFHRLLPVSYISGIDFTVQSVRSCAV